MRVIRTHTHPFLHVKEEFKSKQFTFEIGPEGSKKTKSRTHGYVGLSVLLGNFGPISKVNFQSR